MDATRLFLQVKDKDLTPRLSLLEILKVRL
jgi:hypothetical protein